MPEIISQKEAVERGLKRYFTGVPCKNGHVAERQLWTRNCVRCSYEKQKRFKAKNPELVRGYHSRWTNKNLEKVHIQKRNREMRRTAAITALKELGIEI